MIFAQQKKLKHKLKKEKNDKRKKEEAQGEDAPPKKVPRTIENTREFDETMVQPDDEEVIADEATDEFAEYFKGSKVPKILITTCTRPSWHILEFVKDMIRIIPNSHYYKRGTFDVKSICKFAANRDFTDVIVLNEDRDRPIHLPNGPTAYFRLSSVKLSSAVTRNAKSAIRQKPELILNNFNTRLGHSIGRMFAALFPQDPNFKARQVATFHNQRDYIFFRFHKYIFENKKAVKIQELGPRFTLKLRTLQRGTFDKTNAEYEWFYNHKMDTSRRKFHL